MHFAWILAAIAVAQHPDLSRPFEPIGRALQPAQLQPSQGEVEKMAASTLPAPVDALVKAVNDGNTALFLSLFAPSGTVDDWGRRFVGSQAIRTWSDQEFIGAKGTLTVKSVRQADGLVSVQAGWTSEAYSGDSLFVFVIADGKIREMRITSN